MNKLSRRNVKPERQVGARPGGIITDKYHKTKHFRRCNVLDELCIEQADDHCGLGLTYIDPFLTKICAKNDFIIFVPSDLEL